MIADIKSSWSIFFHLKEKFRWQHLNGFKRCQQQCKENRKRFSHHQSASSDGAKTDENRSKTSFTLSLQQSKAKAAVYCVFNFHRIFFQSTIGCEFRDSTLGNGNFTFIASLLLLHFVLSKNIWRKIASINENGDDSSNKSRKHTYAWTRSHSFWLLINAISVIA